MDALRRQVRMAEALDHIPPSAHIEGRPDARKSHMRSWWQLGEHSGYSGYELDTHRIACPFCEEEGNFKTVAHHVKKKPNSDKRLNFDTLECANCKGYVMVLWS